MRVRYLLAAAIVTAACGGSDSTSPPVVKNVTVEIVTIGDIFSPTFATLNAGDTAKFTFAGGSDNLGHNVRFVPRIAGSPADITVQKAGSVTRVFPTKGTFSYVCDVHPGMNAQIVVQ